MDEKDNNNTSYKDVVGAFLYIIALVSSTSLIASITYLEDKTFSTTGTVLKQMNIYIYIYSFDYPGEEPEVTKYWTSVAEKKKK